jgi:mono/diheme cytochrome c family protein
MMACLHLRIASPRGAGQFVAALAAAVVAGLAPAATEPAPARIDFGRDIRPILAENCYECHGPDARGRKGDLRLDAPGDVFADRGGYRIVTRGRPDESELITRIGSDDPGTRMPPPKSKRTLAPGQIDLLRRWVAEGAPWTEHWAFLPPARPAVPKVADPDWCRNAIDPFILARLEPRGLRPHVEADRAALHRRLSLDLLGLPPAPPDVAAFLADPRPDAYERLVDCLLASPHFGERWGRHWLDLARYADSDGYEDDLARPDAWRYRDWVIAAFNQDLPFDRFTMEQLAGDVLPGGTYEHKLATGFHRMTLTNGVAGRNAEEFRVKTAKDRASTTATVWLGLTLGCAECHSHKYDPLPQRDYYRFYAFFDNLVETGVPAPPLPEKYAAAHRQAMREFEERQARAKAELAAYERDVLPGRQERWEQVVNPQAVPAPIALVLAVPRERRTREQAAQLAQYFRGRDEDYARLRAAVLDGEEVKNNRPQPPSTKALVLAENPQPRQTFVQVRGDFRTPGEEVRPGTPAFLPPFEGLGGAPDRHDLARWMVDPRNPLTARVAVNHVWQHLFGRGLVPTPENFGTQGEPPSHPELLDWLAREFVASGWSRKQLIRLIVTSATYRQSSRHRPELAGVDAANTLLARQNRYRVEAEVVRDLGLAVSGLLNPELGGPSVQPPLPDSLLRRRDLTNERLMAPSTGPDRYRRGVYVNVQRTFPYPMLKEFDATDANAACTCRDRSNTPQQALALWNDPVFVECARGLGFRLLRESLNGRDERIAHAFRLCLARAPTARETAILAEVYETHRVLYGADPRTAGDVVGDDWPGGPGSPVEAASWVAVARTLLNLDEFITRE